MTFAATAPILQAVALALPRVNAAEGSIASIVASRRRLSGTTVVIGKSTLSRLVQAAIDPGDGPEPEDGPGWELRRLHWWRAQSRCPICTRAIDRMIAEHTSAA